MSTASRPLDQIVEDYLAAVAGALSGVPPSQRTELLDNLAEHIAVAREALADETEAGVREILDRLGDPETVAAAARANTDQPPAGIVQPGRPAGRGRWAVIILALLLAGLVMFAFALCSVTVT
ncbi:MAG: hypothetical protein HKP61_03505 [Dactylosporangium sp.]|nr:hypothetical protein [Dactylosporangium sp.]NNJ60020.1 hypothetical protein [Dactylosporangium sp.]